MLPQAPTHKLQTVLNKNCSLLKSKDMCSTKSNTKET